jgi:hypothetical protein
VIETTLARPWGEAWAEIPLAYELLLPQIEILLDAAWTVVFESTFTYVSEADEPQLHTDIFAKVIGVAESRNIPYLSVQLQVPAETARVRALETGRLSPEIAARTVKLHEEQALSRFGMTVDVSDHSIDDIVRQVLSKLR